MIVVNATVFIWAMVLMPLVYGPIAYAASPTAKSDGFTAVAGTESVVMDKKTKNNATVVGGLVFASGILLLAGAKVHIKSNVTKKGSKKV